MKAIKITHNEEMEKNTEDIIDVLIFPMFFDKA